MTKKIISIIFTLTFLLTTVAVPLEVSAASSGGYVTACNPEEAFNGGTPEYYMVTAKNYKVLWKKKGIYVKKKTASKWTKICGDEPLSLITNGSTIYYSKYIYDTDSENKYGIYKMNMQGKSKKTVFTVKTNGFFTHFRLITKYKNNIFYCIDKHMHGAYDLYKYNTSSKKINQLAKNHSGNGVYYKGKIYLVPGDQAMFVNAPTKYFSVKQPNKIKIFKRNCVCIPHYSKNGNFFIYSKYYAEYGYILKPLYIYYWKGNKMLKSKKLPNSKYELIRTADFNGKYVFFKKGGNVYKFYLATSKLKAI